MTLLEVMVALVIFSTAALALMNSVSLNVRFTHGLAETLQASWVAENQLAEAQLSKTDFPNAIRVYAEGDKSQPVISLQIIGPGEESK